MQGAVSTYISKRASEVPNYHDTQALDVLFNNQLKSHALHNVGRAILAGLGIGAAGRSLVGLSQMSYDNLSKKDDMGSNSTIAELPVPYLARDEGEDDEEVKPKFRKRAAGLFLDERAAAPPPADSPEYFQWANYSKPNRGFTGFLAGDDANSVYGIPWYIPAAGLGLAGSMYGGWKLTDWLLKKRQKAQTEDELEEAKDNYRKALLAQYTPEQLEKHSSDKLAESLDKLWAMVERRSGGDLEKVAALSDLFGGALGAVGLGAGALALGTGIGTYRYIKNRSPEERLKKVIQQRKRERWLRHPPEIYAVPTQIPVTEPLYADNEDDEGTDDELRDKAANFVNGFLKG